jgi:hypothetical protein
MKEKIVSNVMKSSYLAVGANWGTSWTKWTFVYHAS